MKILLIDDHALFREGLKHILAKLAEDVKICEAASAEAGLACMASCGDADLVLIDINLPGLSGLEGLRVFRRRFPDCPVVVLSGSDDGAQVKQSLDDGAVGYIHKSASASAMLKALRQVLDGEVGLCPPPYFNAAPASAAGESAAAELTPRQAEVLMLLSEGKTNKEIARDLAMSDNTVRVHLAGIFRILGAKTRTQAVHLARQKRLV